MQSILLNKLIHVVDELISVTNQWMQELYQDDLNTQPWTKIAKNLYLQMENSQIFVSL
jgi:hypothetical protein